MNRKVESDKWKATEAGFTAETMWLLIPGKIEAYCPLFKGTFAQAMAEAFAHALFWNTTTTVYYAPNGRVGENYEVAKVSVPKGSMALAGTLPTTTCQNPDCFQLNEGRPEPVMLRADGTCPECGRKG